MLLQALTLIHHITTMLFGIFLSAFFLGAKQDRKNILLLLSTGAMAAGAKYSSWFAPYYKEMQALGILPASFTTGDLYDHHDAEGFINLFGLSSKVRAMKMQEVEKNNN